VLPLLFVASDQGVFDLLEQVVGGVIGFVELAERLNGGGG